MSLNCVTHSQRFYKWISQRRHPLTTRKILEKYTQHMNVECLSVKFTQRKLFFSRPWQSFRKLWDITDSNINGRSSTDNSLTLVICGGNQKNFFVIIARMITISWQQPMRPSVKTFGSSGALYSCHVWIRGSDECFDFQGEQLHPQRQRDDYRWWKLPIPDMQHKDTKKNPILTLEEKPAKKGKYLLKE